MISEKKEKEERLKERSARLKIALKSTSATASIACSESDPLFSPTIQSDVCSPQILITETESITETKIYTVQSESKPHDCEKKTC